MNFKELISRKHVYAGSKGKTVRALTIKDLGEWAWEYLEERIEIYGQKEKWHSIYKEECSFLEWLMTAYDDPWGRIDIAVACLGEKEIEKRLKELKG